MGGVVEFERLLYRLSTICHLNPTTTEGTYYSML